VGGGGAATGGEAKAPTDPMAVMRQDLDRLRGELVELRALIETVQRGATEHADRAASETRSEMDAVQKALEASARHDLQRQVEVLDAQARRIDVLDKRAAEQGQVLRRVELAITGIESQLARVLENPPASSGRPPRPGGPVRSGVAPGATEDARSSGFAAAGVAPTGAAARADLVPPAMPGMSQNPRSSGAAAPISDAKAEPAAPRPGAPAKTPAPASEDASRAVKPAEAARDAKAAPSAGPSSSDAARGTAKAAPAPEPKSAPVERSVGEAAAAVREPKARPRAAPPGAGSSTARELFARAMQSWDKGERGQAVLDFEELVQKFPSDPLVAAAQFRIGEAYYAARDFERAAQGYRKVVELEPAGKDTPQALLRLGLAYRAQKREADARQAWNQLVRDFPESDVTEEARRALRGR
jgi:TolA-binding protein